MKEKKHHLYLTSILIENAPRTAIQKCHLFPSQTKSNASERG